VPTQPLLITDQDVLTVINEDDEIASDTDAAFQSLGASVPAAMAIAWANDLAAYKAWSIPARSKLEGGFFAGQWFGMPDAYGVAVYWAQRLKRHAADAASLGAKLPELPDTPDPSTPVTVTPVIGTAIIGAELAVIAVAVAAILVLRKL